MSLMAEIRLAAYLFTQTITAVRSFDAARITWDDRDLLSPSRRGNFCDLQEDVTAGRVEFHQALRGQNLSVAFFAQTDNSHLIQYDTGSQALVGGFFVEALQELSRRGGFAWRNAVALTERKISDGEGHTPYLERMVSNYDMFIHCFSATADRYKRGIRFPYYLMDYSLTLVSRTKEKRTPWYDTKMLLYFLGPFDANVWMALMICFVMSGVVYAMLESGRGDASEGSVVKNMLNSTWLTIVSYTGGGGMTPETGLGKLFLLSWSFLVLLMVSAYTANLTTSMVVKKQLSTPVTSMEDATRKGLPICVRSNNDQVVVAGLYPSLNIIFKDSNSELYDGLSTRECAGAVVKEVDFTVQSRKKSANPNCDIARVGRSFSRGGGSFALQSDTGNQCTSLVSDVIEALFQDMDADGWIREKWEEIAESVSDAHCDSEPEGSDGDEDGIARIESTSGIFLIHGACTIVCMFLYAGQLCITRALGWRVSSPRFRGGGVSMGPRLEGPEQAGETLAPDASAPKVDARLTQIQEQLARLEVLVQPSLRPETSRCKL